MINAVSSSTYAQTSQITQESKTVASSSFEEAIEATKPKEQIQNQKDYSKMTLEELESLPFEELEANIDAIRKRAQESPKVTLNFLAKLSAVDFTPHSHINKAIYEGAQQAKYAFMYMTELQGNLADYARGKPMHGSFSYEHGMNGTIEDYMTKEERGRINYEDFFQKAFNTFSNQQQGTKGEVSDQYQVLIDMYSHLISTTNKK